MIYLILKIASYTYGPLLGLFAFAGLTLRCVRQAWVPWVAISGPLVCGLIDAVQPQLFQTWRIGLELLLINGALVFGGLWLCGVGAQTSEA